MITIKSAILLSAALCLGAMTQALAQTTGSSGSSTGNNDTGYDSARTGNGVSDSYGNAQDSKTVPSVDDTYDQSQKRKAHGDDVGTESDLNKNSTGTSSSDVNLDQGTKTHHARSGRSGTAGKHGGAHDGGTMTKDGGR